MNASEHLASFAEAAYRHVREPTALVSARLDLRKLRRQTRGLKRRVQGDGDEPVRQKQRLLVTLYVDDLVIQG